ncbi:hypothetical protein TWF281_011358 [Arthrobotrys megalospora]
MINFGGIDLRHIYIHTSPTTSQLPSHRHNPQLSTLTNVHRRRQCHSNNPPTAAPQSLQNPTHRSPPSPLSFQPTHQLHPHPRHSPSKLRYDIYGPLLLLPPTSPLTTEPWSTYISILPPSIQSSLYSSLAKSLNTTHIAINAPIPAKSTNDGNLIRSPQITPLYGSFGSYDSTEFNSVFWTSTSQHGIFQTWCPLHTMFSRGNITEKARIYEIVSRQLNGTGRPSGRKTAAVDLFVGIGYFAFSYLKAGVDVVYGWDINRWSIEGCRRGAVGNKWGVKVGTTDACESKEKGGERLVIFEESNEYAPTRLRKVKEEMESDGREWPHVMHVNLGLLPTSEGSYKTALEVLRLNDGSEDSWVHVHENVAKSDVEDMKADIIRKFEELSVEVGIVGTVEVICEHVEFVKSWAPRVWHCVFDVKIGRRRIIE